MDSLTQIVLGAAVGEAVLGKKIGNKAMLYGAIAGTIPDLDIFSSYFTDTVSALEIHRGITHSVFFSVIFAPICAWLVTRYEAHKSIKDWSWLFFWGFITHSLLDAHTTWGTQLLWPLEKRFAFQTIFVIDPLYTLPFLIFIILAMRQNKASKKRRRYNKLGLMVSTGYLGLAFLLKSMAYVKFETALNQQNISYKQMDTRPSPMNTILWSANIETETAYLLGNYSFFDTQPIHFETYPKNHEDLGELATDAQVQRMIAISEGWFTINKTEDQLLYNDLRFGLLSMEKGAQNFVFQYEITTDRDGTVSFIEQKRDKRDGKKMLADLWMRLRGN